MSKTCGKCGFINADYDLILKGGVTVGKDGDIGSLKCIKCGAALSWWDDPMTTELTGSG